jgi:ABC-type uncharacterized transport system permease subunit
MGELAVILFWPAVAGYAEAAVAYAGDTLRPGRLVRWAIWGVRLGWLAQTALLVAQAAHADRFPWGSWAGSLNLFVWMCVGAYLIWGCRAPFRLLGLAVMPLAALLLVLAWAVGGAAEPGHSQFGDVFLVFHVGLALAGFAGFTIAAALALLYLWQDRRLKRHTPHVLRLHAPSLETLDSLAWRTIGVALPALTLAIGIGFARLGTDGGSLDATMAVTLLAWVVYAAYLVLRYEAGWRGRRAAYLVLSGFALVVLVRLVLTPFTHF